MIWGMFALGKDRENAEETDRKDEMKEDEGINHEQKAKEDEGVNG